MRIRTCTLRDLPRVVRIERTSFGQEAYSVTTFLAHVLRDRRGLLVAEDEEGRIVGYALSRAGLRWLGVRRGGITSIAVDPPHRRRGFGRALMAAALDYLRDSGVEEADLEVNVGNRAAQSLYQAFGFVQSRLLPHYYGLDENGLKMVLDMRPSSATHRAAQAGGAHRSRNG
ncbi:MAG TPA: N-acetyltransferase [Armatimonadota bacterium]|nr:N-acetyltransferase [Armatimonadota bacterium]